MKMQIYLRTGQDLIADVDEITIVRSPTTNEIDRLEWTTPKKKVKRKLATIDLGQIVAIVTIHEEGDNIEESTD